MPIADMNGALSTYPVAGSHGHYGANPFDDPATTRPTAVESAELEKLVQLDRSRGVRSKSS